MTTKQTGTIILADDHEVVRAGLRDTLARLEPDYAVVEAGDLAEALDCARAASDAALLILDFYMPGMNGAEGVRTAGEAFPMVPVAIMSGSARDSDIEAAMNAGAAGFIPKTMRIAAMANALRLILAGEKYLPFEYMGGQKGESDGAAGLTPRERETLKEIARGLSNKEIARTLGIEEVTVKLHAANAFRKLGVSNRTQAAMKAHELGLD